MGLDGGPPSRLRPLWEAGQRRAPASSPTMVKYPLELRPCPLVSNQQVLGLRFPIFDVGVRDTYRLLQPERRTVEIPVVDTRVSFALLFPVRWQLHILGVRILLANKLTEMRALDKGLIGALA